MSIRDAALTADNMRQMDALKERFHARVNEIAQAVLEIRQERTNYGEEIGWNEEWVFANLKTGRASLDKFEFGYTNPDEIEAEFGGYCGDSYETHTVSFPASYLDMVDLDWLTLEGAKITDLREAYETANRERAAKARATRIENQHKARVEAVEWCEANFPGWKDMDEAQREAVLEMRAAS